MPPPDADKHSSDAPKAPPDADKRSSDAPKAPTDAKKLPSDAVNEQFDLAATWLGRGITIVLVMIGPGLLGMYLDKRWQTGWITPTGFVLGMVLGLGLLLLLVQIFPPPEGDPSKYVKLDDPSPASDDGESKHDHDR